MTSKAPGHIFQRGTVLKFRIAIPGDLREQLGRHEIRKSLRTGQLSTARRTAAALSLALLNFFDDVRKGIFMGTTRDELLEAINNIMDSILLDDHKRRLANCNHIHRHHLPIDPDPWDSLQEENFAGQALLAYSQLEKSKHYPTGFREHIHNLMTKHGICVDADSHKIDDFMNEYVRAIQVTLETIILRERNPQYPYETQLSNLVPASTRQIASVVRTKKQSNNSELFSTTFEKYCHEHISTKRWSLRTQREFPKKIERFRDIMGDMPIADIDRATALDFFDKLKKETVGVVKRKPISDTTVNNIMEAVSGFFKWAVRNGFMQKNYAEGLSVKVRTDPRKYRDAFSDEDLSLILNAPGYANDSFKQPFMFWVPLLALYSGARLEELCQLQKGDVALIDDIWCFRFESGEGKNIKTESSERVVPLHPVLYDKLKFQEFVKACSGKSNTRIFNTLRLTGGKYGHYASRWFGAFTKEIGLRDSLDGKKVFHSFRHTFATKLFEAIKDETMVSIILGHRHKGETMGRYSKGLPPGDLLEVIRRLEFTVDWKHLLGSRFVVK